MEREKLTQLHAFPQGYRDLRTNAEGSVLGVVTGVGTAKSTATIMALGLDPRFDLTKSYWLVAGIAGRQGGIAEGGEHPLARLALGITISLNELQQGRALDLFGAEKHARKMTGKVGAWQDL